MAWSYRRSIGAGPFRVSLSKRGVGYSVGVPGFRVGVRSNGRRYRTVSIPGTGLYNTTSTRGGGCALIAVGWLLLAGGTLFAAARVLAARP